MFKPVWVRPLLFQGGFIKQPLGTSAKCMQFTRDYQCSLDIVGPALLVDGGLPSKRQAGPSTRPGGLGWQPTRGARHVAANR